MLNRTRARRTLMPVAALAAAAALVAGCSSDDTDVADSAPVTDPADSAGAGSTGTRSDPVPAAPADAEEIEAITRTYLTGDNNGDQKMIEHALCGPTLDQLDLSILAPSERPQQIEAVEDVQMLDGVDGDSAMAVVSFTYLDDPEADPMAVPLGYLREDGDWKVCTE